MAHILDDRILLCTGFISHIILYRAHAFPASPEIYGAETSLTRVIQENQDSNVSQLVASL